MLGGLALIGATAVRVASMEDGHSTAFLVGVAAPCAVAVVLGVSPEITKEIARDIPAEAEPSLEEG